MIFIGTVTLEEKSLPKLCECCHFCIRMTCNGMVDVILTNRDGWPRFYVCFYEMTFVVQLPWKRIEKSLQNFVKCCHFCIRATCNGMEEQRGKSGILN